MNRKLLKRAVLPAICLALAQCSASTTTTEQPPTATAVLRFSANGILDTSFNASKGIAITDVNPGFDFANAATVQPADNKIVAVGSSGLGGQGIAFVARYNSDGTLDTTTFGPGGTGGIVTTPAPAGWTAVDATAVAIQSDNKIVVAALTFDAVAGNTGIVLMRFLPSGAPDTTFGLSGSGVSAVTTIGKGSGGDSCAMALQGTNIVVAGASSDGNIGNIVLARYDTNGALDALNFGTGGKTVTMIGTQAMSPALAFQSTGAIIVASGNEADHVVLRYSATGAPDAIFGKVVTDVGGTDFANAVAVQSDDKIVVAGHANVNTAPNVNTSDITLVRYNADGTLDTTFTGPAGNARPGIVVTDLNGAFDNAFSVALQTPAAANTSILVSGNSGTGGFAHLVLLRYTTLGVLDSTFGNGGTGIVATSVVGPSNLASANAIVVTTLGIVVAGYD